MKSLRDIYKDYRAHKFSEEVCSDWGSVVFYRAPAMLLAWLLMATPVTPNMVTATNALLLPCMILAAATLAPQAALGVIIVLGLLYLVLDCTDGLLARATGRTSAFGHFCDLVTDIAYRGVVYVTVGYVADQISPLTVHMDQAAIFAVAAWLAAFARLTRDNAERLSERHTPSSTRQFTLFSFFSGLDTVFPVLALCAWWADYLSAFTVWIFVFSLGDAAAALIGSRVKFR